MADTDTTTAPDPNQLIQQLAQQLGSMGQVPQADQAPVNRSFASLLGEAVGGGDPTGMMSPAQHEAAGTRALLNFGAGMLAASGYHPVRTTLGEAFAQGLQGAGQSEAGSAEAAYNVLGQRQQLAMKQQEMRLAALKEAIPLLRLQMGANIPNPLSGGANTSIGAVGQQAPTFEGAIAGREGTAPNPNSSAAGVGQFLVPTWNAFAKANPQLFQGMTQDQILAARNNPQIANQAITWLAQQNAATLTAAGVTPSGQSLGISHYLGAGPAAKIMGAPDTDPVSKYVGGDAVKANPELGTMTVGQMKQRYAAMPAPGFLNAKAPPAPAQAATAPAQPPRIQVASLTPQVPQPPAAPAQPPPVTTGGLTPPVVTTTPPTTTTPPATTQATQPPPAAPGGKLTFEQWQQQHPMPQINPATYTVTPPDLTAAIAAKNAASQTLDLIHKGLSTADPNKAVQAYTEASQNVTKLQQDAQSKSLELQQKAQQAAIDTQRQLYDAEMQRAQQADEAEKQRQAQVALKTQEGQQQEALERIKAGQTFHTQLAQQSAEYAQANTIKPMAEQALKAHQMNTSLAMLQPLIKDLPPSGGALGTILDAHQDLAPLFNQAGIINDKQADTLRLVNGLVANISTEMKPTGLGALREYEWNAFKAQLPSMLSTPDGAQKAIATLMQMNDRTQQESSWMNNYFNRQIPDEVAQAPGATRVAHDLNTTGGQSVQQMMDKDLGPVIPSYKGPMNEQAISGWEQSQPPGKVYYRPYASRDPRNPNQPLRDSTGNVVYETHLGYRPWQ